MFWSGRSHLRGELPRDWSVFHLGPYTDTGNPVPNPKPLEEVRYFCDSIRGWLILHPFMGSGTTGIAAILAGKRLVGIEQDEVYFKYACKRIAVAVHKTRAAA